MPSRHAPGLPVGKLPVDLLRSFLARVPARDPRVLVGPGIGEDAAVIQNGDRSLVVSTDPITLAGERIGRYAVHVNANDVAVMGARPAWFFVVLLLPESATTPELVDAILADVQGACDDLGVTLCGGHTEITQGLDRPILVGQMIGEVQSIRLLLKARVAVGDQVLLTRGVAIEGTAILARERPDLADALGRDLIERAAQYLVTPGISVVDAALVAAETEGVHAMHDPTEGGLLAGLVELVAPASLGLLIDRERIPVLPETQALCGVLGIDPLKLIASGALLVAASPEGAERVRRAFEDRRIPVSTVGEVLPSEKGLTISSGGHLSPLVAPERDEIARFFAQDMTENATRKT
jgi:hydrogenase expression/formation protein HypE